MFTEKLELLIDGVWCQGSSGETTELRNPANDEVLGNLPKATIADLDRALDASERGFAVWKEMTAMQRWAIMDKAAALIEERKDDIARTLTLENGKALAEATGEVQFAADATRWYAEEGKRAYGRIIPARMPGVRQMVYKEPVGPVAAFAAWNFPSSNVIRKIAGALGAGCSVILKPSDETPGTAIAIGRCFQDAGVPAGVIGIVFGDASEISQHLIASPIPRKVSLTGSTPVGKLLQRQSAEGLKRCTMELGGHAPVIVYDDADLEKALDALVTFKFRNGGQVCTSPTRFYVQKGIYQAFVDGFVERTKKLKVGNGLEEGIQMGPMIAPRRLDVMDEFVEDAQAKGAKVLVGGSRMDQSGYFYAPTVLADVPDDAMIMNEEPFGPLAPITSFTDFEDVISRANSLEFGLASFVFTKDLTKASKTESALNAGLVGVNHLMVSTPETPFGGVNASGYGSESGIEGLDAFLRTKFVTEAQVE
ncbi:NAD-dependent succinate-semialdehyde dehydrogenase [Thalassospira sp. HF15]|uniref:NAD-dependent succinate-semialdehyde dehydrogenase n=1 Tax=Thalassospira sp. HF15 TaxID=2722755 RepID=UPI00142F7768|nr:NAD-dependent succinate-semialdehyde dehydrogenase [Thalassospira sp. HF15]NIY75326.1 NAD-dependent succinate-semialdehyde dehydrogenase [Thalassospira sp. HF15]